MMTIEMRKIIGTLLFIFLLAGCDTSDKAEMTPVSLPPASAPVSFESAELSPNPTVEAETTSASVIHADGATIKERFSPPDGFTRTESERGSFEEFLRELPLKPDGSAVKYFNGSEKTRDVYLAVVDYTLGDRDLQQCADAVMRLRAEYFYSVGQLNKIHFNFVNGFTAYFSKWAEGNGVAVKGNNASWVKNSKNNDSYESFQKYLDIVYAYANTYSLENELISKDVSALAIGDVFIIGGFPGHCVIVVDMAVNMISGEKVFMLAQSFMPAQDIHILKGDHEDSPWYSANIGNRLYTPEWTFDRTQLKTWP